MIITLSSWKGGTGKTTLNTTLARLLADGGKKVLLIDLDSNCALSQVFDCIMKDYTSMQLLSGPLDSFDGVYRAGENIDIIPGDIRMSRLNNITDSQLKINLKRAGLVEKYDYIIIDPPGYWGAHSRNAVFASDVVVIPAACSRIDFAATRLYLEELRCCEVGAEIFICINCFNNKTNLPGIYDEYKNEFAGFVMDEPVPYIASLKKITGGQNFIFNPAVKAKLLPFVKQITGGQNA
ncbi:MAG: ParA family protein [Spirochaetaceae bacterium]|jgi:cellulose biosynthesis protein BcsQ|nr:ParA family protein [Spirochaetaceae bacterium]